MRARLDRVQEELATMRTARERQQVGARSHSCCWVACLTEERITSDPHWVQGSASWPWLVFKRQQRGNPCWLKPLGKGADIQSLPPPDPVACALPQELVDQIIRQRDLYRKLLQDAGGDAQRAAADAAASGAIPALPAPPTAARGDAAANRQAPTAEQVQQVSWGTAAAVLVGLAVLSAA